MDPHHLAKLGLADAERAGIMRPDAAQPHICKGNALQAVEEYIDAEAAYFAALSRDPSNTEAQVQLCTKLCLHRHNPSWVYALSWLDQNLAQTKP